MANANMEPSVANKEITSTVDLPPTLFMSDAHKVDYDINAWIEDVFPDGVNQKTGYCIVKRVLELKLSTLSPTQLQIPPIEEWMTPKGINKRSGNTYEVKIRNLYIMAGLSLTEAKVVSVAAHNVLEPIEVKNCTNEKKRQLAIRAKKEANSALAVHRSTARNNRTVQHLVPPSDNLAIQEMCQVKKRDSKKIERKKIANDNVRYRHDGPDGPNGMTPLASKLPPSSIPFRTTRNMTNDQIEASSIRCNDGKCILVDGRVYASKVRYNGVGEGKNGKAASQSFICRCKMCSATLTLYEGGSITYGRNDHSAECYSEQSLQVTKEQYQEFRVQLERRIDVDALAANQREVGEICQNYLFRISK